MSDIVERAKEFTEGINSITLSSAGDPHKALLLMNELIAEVEKQRAENADLSKIRFERDERICKQEEEIESLTKELAEVKKERDEFIEKGLTLTAEKCNLLSEVKSLKNCASSWTTEYRKLEAKFAELKVKCNLPENKRCKNGGL